MNYQPVIGLEIHVQLKTKSKMFCRCAAHDAAVAPNTNVCPVCMGHPGSLPVPNEEAIRFAILTGLALGGAIAAKSKFDRKNYFYPDLPKGYQISQFDLPIATGGFFEFAVPGGVRDRARIGITRVHLEEDAAKSFHHAEGNTYVDFNRGGVPLVEIVTEPDFATPQEAKIFLQELRLIARYLRISDADMEKGHLRCDANISLRAIGEDGSVVGASLNPKTEIKNLNSFKAVERALEHEIQRQTKLWNEGAPPDISSTRGWNDAKQITEAQRTKESSEDYRYFPEPDIPPLDLAPLVDGLRRELPELPATRRERFRDEYRLNAEDARQLCEDLDLGDYAEQVFSELHAWLDALPELDGAEDAVWEAHRAKLAKLVSGWLVSKLGGLMNERGIAVRTLKISPENFAEFVTLLVMGRLSTANGLTVLTEMLESGKDPSQIMEDKQLGLITDESFLADVVDRVLAGNPAEVERYRAGELQLLKLFIGLIMKETEGKADPKMANNILRVKLG